MSYRFHPAAEAEHLEQIAFYESQRTGLGARYREHFLQLMQRVCEHPTQYPIEHQPDIRRVRLRPFPLTVIYRERNAVIQVLAVAHYRRRPGYWLARVLENEGIRS
ncbi:MAG: type II toxin-antitoxin system RelE/ParE family toxin [Steroidobacteraceae bacterium]